MNEAQTNKAKDVELETLDVPLASGIQEAETNEMSVKKQLAADRKRRYRSFPKLKLKIRRKEQAVDESKLSEGKQEILRLSRLIKQSRLFEDVSSEVVLMLAGQPGTCLVEFLAGASFYVEGQQTDNIYLLLSGLAAVVKLDSKSEKKGDKREDEVSDVERFVNMRGPNQQIGLALAISGAKADSSCKALTACRAIQINKKGLIMAFQMSEKLIETAFQSVAERLRIFQYRYDLARSRDYHMMFAVFLAHLDDITQNQNDNIYQNPEIRLDRKTVASLLKISYDHFRKFVVAPLINSGEITWDDSGYITIEAKFREIRKAAYEAPFGEI